MLVRLFLAPGDRVPALKLILLALVALVVTDFPYAVVSLEGGYYTGHILEAGWLAASSSGQPPRSIPRCATSPSPLRSARSS